MTAAADARVASWPSITRDASFIYRCKSGGFFVNLDGVFPTWRATEDEIRNLLGRSGLPTDAPVVDL